MAYRIVNRFLSLFAATFAFSMPAFAAPAASPVEIIIPNGQFVVEVKAGDRWERAGSVPFVEQYDEASLDLGPLAKGGQPLTVRLVKERGGKAFLDHLLLGGKGPVAWNGTEPEGVALLAARDHDVADATGGLTLTFPADRPNSVLTFSARVEPKVLSGVPFVYPEQGKIGTVAEATKFYDYTLGSRKGSFGIEGDVTEVDGIAPLASVLSVPATGHPEGTTHLWTRDDGTNLYGVVEFTADNTRDGDADYAALRVVGPTGEQTFTVTEPDQRWGKVSFTRSARAAYRHKFYEFRIPLEKIGARAGETVKLAFAAYGTASPLSVPADGTTFDFGNVTIDTSSTMAVTLKSTGINKSVDVYTTTGDTSMFADAAGSCSLNDFTYSPNAIAIFGNVYQATIGGCTINLTFTPTSLGTKSANLALRVITGGVATSNVTLTGNGAPDRRNTHTLRVSVDGPGTVSGGGISCPGTCSVVVSAGTTVTLSASPDAGATFDGWKGLCGGTGSCTWCLTTTSRSAPASAPVPAAAPSPPRPTAVPPPAR